MTVFTIGDIAVAIAVGLAIGIAVVAGFMSRHKSNMPAWRALEQQMGPLLTGSLLASGALPTAAMVLVGSLRSTPTPLDAMVIVVLIGFGMLASYTLVGNVFSLTEPTGRR